MAWILLLGHGLLSVGLLTVGRAPDATRRGMTRVAAVVGVALGTATVLARTSGAQWRGVTLSPTTTVVAGSAAAIAWLLVGLLPWGATSWRTGVLVGTAATGLGLFATGRWAVPALLFWECSSLALGALVLDRADRGVAWTAIVLSDAALAVGLISQVVDSESWAMPAPAPGWMFWAVVAAAILRSGAIAGAGLWTTLGTPASAGLPIAVGGAFALVAEPANRARPWLALAMLVAALMTCVWGAAHSRFPIGTVGAWPIALGLGIAYSAPEATAGAALAAVVATGTVALWPAASGRAHVERALLVALVPLTIGFGIVVAAATTSFIPATRLEGWSDAASWTAIAAILPGLLAVGVVAAARIGRRPFTDDFTPSAIIGTWALLGVAVLAGLSPELALGLGGRALGAVRSSVVLHVVALAAGVLVAWRWARTYPAPAAAPAAAPPLGVIGVGPRVGRVLAWSALVAGLGVVASCAWITVEGLKVGFL